MKKPPLIWALVDDRAGNTSQVLGVAESLDLPFTIKNIRYDKLGRIPNFIKGRTLIGLTEPSKKEITAPWPDVVISIARKMESVALYIKQQSPETVIVHIQRPYLPFNNFNILAMPEHDLHGEGAKRLPKSRGGLLSPFNKNKIHTKFVITSGAPNRITQKGLELAKEKWEPVFKDLPHPRIAVLVGGTNKKKKFTDKHSWELIDKVNKLRADAGGSLMVTTSRRTPPEAIKLLKENLKEPKFFYDFRDGGENPYGGLLACSDVIIPSGDSVSMCSEACTTGKPVYIYSPTGLTSKKHDIFQKTIIAKDYARSLGDKWESWKYEPLSDSKTIAEFIKANLCE